MALESKPPGKTVNAGLPSSNDETPYIPSTLHRELAVDGLTARPFDPQDIEAVRQLFRDGMGMYAKMLPEGTPLRIFFDGYIEKSLASDMRNADTIRETFRGSGGEFWVLDDENGRIVGQVGLQRLSDSEGELRRMAIDPTMRKKGLGSKLVRVIEEHAAAIGLSRLVLTTGSIMAPAVSLYERCGWEPCRYGHPTGEFKEELDRAGQSLVEVAFRKPVTSRNGRWMWHPHSST